MIHAFGPPPTATVPEGDDEDEHVFVCVQVLLGIC